MVIMALTQYRVTKYSLITLTLNTLTTKTKWGYNIKLPKNTTICNYSSVVTSCQQYIHIYNGTNNYYILIKKETVAY